MTPNQTPTASASSTTRTSLTASSSHHPDYYHNAKFEDIATRPLKPVYDGSPAQLVPFLNRLDIRRHD
jgi:hypothetical protein